MTGCHNCNYEVERGKAYEETPCASCKTKQNPQPLSHYDEDPATFQCNFVLHSSLEGRADEEENDDSYTGPINRNLLLSALSRSIRVLMRLRDEHPMTFKILDAKMAEPMLSYSDLAARFQCKKQNVQYHLRKAVGICPELSAALILDTRYLGHHTSIKQTRIAKEAK